MAFLINNIGNIVLMVILLVMSAFFSGSETAFFNLTKKQINQLKHSNHRLSRLAAEMTSKPRQLLSSLLLGNMTVNVLYFATSSLFALKVEKFAGVGAASASAATAFVLILLCGEIFPKSASYSSSVAISKFTALGVYGLTKILQPIIWFFQYVIITPALRLLIGQVSKPRPMSTDEFQSLASQIKRRGLITESENKLLAEIAELHILKARHCLKPRVDIDVCEITESKEQIRAKMQSRHLTKIPVYENDIDNIRGFIYLRDLIINPDSSIKELISPACFVPEQKTIESLIVYFQKTGIDTAIVVDEYGGLAGIISLEDVANEIFGQIENEEQIEAIEQLAPLEYRLSGSIALHQWSKSFGVNFPQARYSTVGGLVAAIIGDIPKPGDTARLGNLLFTVEKVQRNRVITIILKLESLSGDN